MADDEDGDPARGTVSRGPAESFARPWLTTDPDRLVGRGHPIGDFLEAWAWDLLEREDGHVRVSAHLPDHVRNPRGELFGGFTPTYVDFIALHTVISRARRTEPTGRPRLATSSMHVEYFEPVVGPQFIIDSRREKQRGRTHYMLIRFYHDDDLAVMASTTMRELRS